METQRKGKITMPGDLNVKNLISSEKLETKAANIDGDMLVKGKTIIEGDLVISGNVEGINIKQELPDLGTIDSGVLHLGPKDKEGSWRLRIEDEQLYFDKLEEGEWSVRQSLL
jgi:hypothetical protein